MKKRLLAVLLAAIMLLSLVPMMVFATDSPSVKKIELKASMISTNDPMQYVSAASNGADEYGLEGSANWFINITTAQKNAREAKYGLASNLYDGDKTTNFHLNRDWGEPWTSWGARTYSVNTNQNEKRYIQVDFEKSYKVLILFMTISDTGFLPEALEILTSSNGTDFTKFGKTISSVSFGADYTVENIADPNGIKAIRIQNTSEDASWMHVGSAFGLAELSFTEGCFIANDMPEGDSEKNHGYISIDKGAAAEGETVTVTVNPADGYQLKSLKYNDGEDHTITVDKDGKYTFTMPAKAVTVTAEFEVAPAWPKDAPTTAPAAPAHDGASIIGAALTTNYAFEPLDWPGNMPEQLTFATGETIYYSDKMDWQIYTNWAEDFYDMSEYGTLHIDLFPATGTEIKVTIEGLSPDDGGQGYRNSVVKTLTAGQWNGIDIALSEFPALSSGDAYDFSDIRYLILEGYNAEQTALSVGNVYFYGAPAHTHNLVKVTGQAATETAAGFKDYYECKDSTDACHKYFEDATAKVEITDLNAWKAQGGKGYIAPLVHSITPVNGKNATDTEAGYKPYYECKNCGKYYEDATGLIEITDIDAWKSQTGKGYIPSGNEINAAKEALDSENANNPKSSQTGDTSNMTLWVMLLALSSMGLCVCLVLDKKRKNEQ